MSEAGLIELSPSSLVVVEEISRLAGVRPSEYLNQSLRLGIYLTSVLVTAPREPSILFEQQSGSYDSYPIAFPEVVAPTFTTGPDMGTDPDVELDRSNNMVLFAVDPKLHTVTAHIANDLGINHESYLHAGVFLRWQWALTRNHKGWILVDDGNGEPDKYVVHEDDRVLDRVTIE